MSHDNSNRTINDQNRLFKQISWNINICKDNKQSGYL